MVQFSKFRAVNCKIYLIRFGELNNILELLRKQAPRTIKGEAEDKERDVRIYRPIGDSRKRVDVFPACVSLLGSEKMFGEYTLIRK